MDDVMKRVERAVGNDLRSCNFARRGNAFLRDCEDDIRQFVMFFPGPGMSIRQGQFTVELGVYLPIVADVHLGRRPLVPTPAHSQIRTNVGGLREPFLEQWWSRHMNEQETCGDIAMRLKDDAIPFLDRLMSNIQVLTQWQSLNWRELLSPAQLARNRELVRAGHFADARELMHEALLNIARSKGFSGAVDWHPPARVVAAILLASLGQLGKARKLLRRSHQMSAHVGHRRYLEELAHKLDITPFP